MSMSTQSLCLDKRHALKGEIKLIGSKSLSNRALLLASLSQHDVLLKNVLRSDDTQVMLEALSKLGIKIDIDKQYESNITIKGSLQSNLEHKSIELFLGNAGTAMRPLCAVLALLNTRDEYKLIGEDRMYERPIGPLVDALISLGANITYLGREQYPPLLIKAKKTTAGSALENGEYHIDIDGSLSSQFISALLIAGLLLDKKLNVHIKGELISKPYVELTCNLLRDFGIIVENKNYQNFIVHNNQISSPSEYLIEGDASAASYFLAAAAIRGEVVVKGVGAKSYQGDAKFIDVLKMMGAQIEKGEDYLKVKSAKHLKGIEIDMNDMPDVAMTLVPMAVFTQEPIIIKNIASWRVKECDRIDALATQMRKLGCYIEEGSDYIVVSSKTSDFQQLKHSDFVPSFDTYNDHRMAMALALISLDRKIIIKDPQCCNKTFPEFFTWWQKLSVN